MSEARKPVLTERTKASRMHRALATLASEYAASTDGAEKACSKTVHRVMMDLPDYSKAKLYDILTEDFRD